MFGNMVKDVDRHAFITLRGRSYMHRCTHNPYTYLFNIAYDGLTLVFFEPKWTRPIGECIHTYGRTSEVLTLDYYGSLDNERPWFVLSARSFDDPI